MAIIQRLRNSSWVAIVIGAALVLFIVGDWLTGKNNGPTIDEDRDVIAIIGDEKVREAEIVSIADKYYRDELERDPNYQLDKDKSSQLFQRSWFDLLKDKTVNAQIANSGVRVSDEDINEMMVGTHPDESIKGDIDIIPRGAINLAMKETMNVRRLEFMNATANQADMEIIGAEGRASIIREVAKGLQLPTDDIVPSRDKAAVMGRLSAADQAAQSQQPQAQQPQALLPDGSPKGGAEGNMVTPNATGAPA